jgi:hypothetical protein
MRMSSNDATFKINKSSKVKVEMQSTKESVMTKLNNNFDMAQDNLIMHGNRKPSTMMNNDDSV